MTALAVSRVVKCFNCRLQHCKPSRQILGFLPEQPTNPKHSFTNGAIDVFGHYIVKDQKSSDGAQSLHARGVTN